MFSRSIGMAALGVLAAAANSFAGFSLSAFPSAQPATGAGLVAYDLFAQSDPDPSDGVRLQAFSFTFTALNNTKARFLPIDNGDGTFGADHFNFGPGTSGTNILDRNASNLRIGTRTANQHGFALYPGDANNPLTPDEAANGVTTFTSDCTLLGAALSVPALNAPGARFARLVLAGGGAFNVDAFFGGEVGSKSAASLTFHPPLPTSPPIIIPGSTASVVFGQIVTSGAPFSVVVNVMSAFAADQLSLTAGAVAGISNIAITPTSATSPASFTVTGLVDYTLNGQLVVIPVSASNGIATGSGSFSLIVTPEPGSLLAFGFVGLLCRRTGNRSKRE